MRILPKRIAEVKAGMVAAKPVTSPKGMVLCAEGTVLTDKILARLEQMDIATVFVQVEENLSESEYEAQKATIEKRFAAITPSSMLGNLKKVLLGKLEDARK